MSWSPSLEDEMSPFRSRSPSCWLTPALLLALLGGCRSPQPSAIVIARYNDRPLTLQAAMETFLDSHVGHGVLVQGEPAVRELAGRIIERQVFLDEAHALGLDQDEVVLEAAEEYRLRTAELLFWKREVDESIEISDEEVESFYEKTDQALSISLIETAEREQAEQLCERVLAGEDIGILARQHSIHDSAELGGMLSFVRRGEIDPTMEAPVFGLAAEGDLTPVTQTATGWAFARLDQRTINETRPPREVAIPQIRSILTERAKDRRRAELKEQALASAEAFVDDELLTQEALLGEDRPEAVVARSAGESLTLQAFRDSLNLEAVSAASAELAGEATEGLVQEWVERQAIRAHVRRSGLLDDPEVVAKVRVFREDAALKTLYERYVYADIEIDEDDIRAYYEERKETEFTRPPEVHLAFIVQPTEEEIRAVLQRVEAGEDFGALAREVSTDAASASHGGRIGWVRPGTILPELEKPVFSTEVGTTAGPLETSVGWFLISVLGRKEAVPLSYETSRSVALKRLNIELQKQAYLEWGLRLKDRSVAEVDEEGISQAVEWLDREAARRAAQAPVLEGVAPASDDLPAMHPVTAGAEAAPQELP
jgi:parvulin-like peptidyl-prolyl isomerase